MNFLSDNTHIATPEILADLAAANTGMAPPYGDDALTAELQATMSAVFEREVTVFPLMTGTAANALALSTLTPPHGTVLCHAESHVISSECGSLEFFTHGGRATAIESAHGKLTPETLEAALKRFVKGATHSLQPAAVSFAQPTECGAVYTLDEIRAISELCARHGLKLHLDGARFASALAHLGCTPAEATWKAGVDVMSFGASKNGAFCAEAVIFFDKADVRDFAYRCRKAGHQLSKMRFVSAQLLSYVKDGRWLKTAARANALAERLAEGLSALPGAEPAYPVQSNMVIIRLPDETISHLRNAGALFYDWAPSENGRTLVRFALSFATPEEDIEHLLASAADAPASA